MVIIGRNMSRLNFIGENIVALDGIQSTFYLHSSDDLHMTTVIYRVKACSLL
jgi:hypothetical protein